MPERRPALIAGLALVAILAWAYVVGVARMPALGGGPAMDMAMPGSQGATLLALFAMWAAMMVGMMLPTVTPSILLFAAMARQRRESGRESLSVPAFVSGYLGGWIGFSALAALLQTRLSTALLDPARHVGSATVAAGVVLLLAGAYQWTPLKAACLTHCRSPLGHFSAHWRETAAGAFRMGLDHGMSCLGCCWLLMGLLFVGGVMNPYWVGGLTLLVLLEKLVPRGDLVGRFAGIGLAVWGVWLIAAR